MIDNKVAIIVMKKQRISSGYLDNKNSQPDEQTVPRSNKLNAVNTTVAGIASYILNAQSIRH